MSGPQVRRSRILSLFVFILSYLRLSLAHARSRRASFAASSISDSSTNSPWRVNRGHTRSQTPVWRKSVPAIDPPQQAAHVFDGYEPVVPRSTTRHGIPWKCLAMYASPSPCATSILATHWPVYGYTPFGKATVRSNESGPEPLTIATISMTWSKCHLRVSRAWGSPDIEVSNPPKNESGKGERGDD